VLLRWQAKLLPAAVEEKCSVPDRVRSEAGFPMARWPVLSREVRLLLRAAAVICARPCTWKRITAFPQKSLANPRLSPLAFFGW